MKFSTLLLFFLLLGIPSQAQNWYTDMASAQAKARSDKKPILLVFQGSDWCAPCIRLDREVWSTDTFGTYASDHYVMLQADFPRKKQNALPPEQAKANALLAERYNKRGIFPLVVVLDPEGKVLGETSYMKLPPKEYIDHLNTIISKG